MPAHRRHSARFALRLALLYWAVAGTWIVASDRVLAAFTHAPTTFSLAQTAKGLGFVTVTAALLFLLIRRDYRLLRRRAFEVAAAQAQVDAVMGQALREQLPIVVWTTDRDLRLTALTGSLVRRVLDDGTAAELIGTPVGSSLLGPGANDLGVRMHERALAGEPGSYVRSAHGLRLELHVEALRDPATEEVVGVVGLGLDVSERERLEERRRQAARLEAVGRLAGGVAHDFNNLLTGMLGFLGFALRSLGQHPARADLEQAERAARRAADLTQQLLTFARRDDGVPGPLDVGATVRSLLPLLDEVAGAEVRVEHEEVEPCWAAIRPLPFEQVVVNLVANARDAQPQGGSVIVRTTTEGRDGEQWAAIEVVDEGHGISEDARRHLFEPFFTTKPVGRGTGLGLATSLATVEEVGGRIDVESEPGRGTRFVVLLPCAEPPDETLPAPPPEPIPAEPAPRRILLVEDEEALRELFRRWLTDAGHAVEPAAGAREALALLAPGRFDAIVSDVTLPDGSGLDVAAAARALEPEQAIVLMSGRAIDPAQLPEGASVLAKPFGRDDLLRALER